MATFQKPEETITMSNETKLPDAKLHTVIGLLKRFSGFDTSMQVSTILTLLEIARSDDLKSEVSVQDIEKQVGLLSGTASRNVYYWAEGHREMRGGHGFVRIDFGKDRRRRALTLTPKGRAFIHSAMDLL